MIRILFTIVAVVAAILGVILPMPELFAAAAVALIVTVALMLVRLQRRRSTHKEAASTYTPPPSTGDDDLASFGILEIRPRQKDAPPAADDTVASDDADVAEHDIVAGDGAAEEPTPPPDVDDHAPAVRDRGTNGSRTGGRPPSTIMIKEKAQTVRASVDESVPGHYQDVLVPYLQSFRAAIDAHTVCLLKQPSDALHFHIEAIVSLNAYARSGGTFSTKVPLLQTIDSRSPADVRRVSAEDFPPAGLGYYREAIAVKEIAVAAVPGLSSHARYVLLADSMKEHGLDSERRRAIMSHFARLLGAVIDQGSGSEILDAYDYVRPRREIIDEEMTHARNDSRPLALALVYLNHAETIADLGEREVKSAEHALAAHLRETARNARVERFGELTFGVFFGAQGPEVESWATRLQHDLAEADGPLAGGVSIGIAFLQDRHSDADAFRRDATDALREAYESGTCTIVE